MFFTLGQMSYFTYERRGEKALLPPGHSAFAAIPGQMHRMRDAPAAMAAGKTAFLSTIKP